MHTQALVASLLLALSAGAPAGETWLRVDAPGAALRAELPDAAIDYGAFVWLPESEAALLRSSDPSAIRVHVDPFVMRIDHRRIDPVDAFGADASGVFRGTGTVEADFRLVQFGGPIKREWLDELRRAGAEPIQYVAPFGYVVWAAPDALQRAARLRHVRFAGEFPPVLRVPLQARSAPDPNPHAMALIHAPSAGTVLARLRAAGAGIIGAPHRIDPQLAAVQLRTLPSTFETLARVPGVFTVQQIGQDAGPRGEMSNQSVVGGWRLDAMNQPVLETGYLDWLAPTGLDGSGVTVGIVDGGIWDSHPDLVGNMVPCLGSGASCSNGADSHGTHVAGAVGGTGASGAVDPAGFLRGQGVAPGVSLVEQRYEPLIGGGPGGMVPGGMLSIYRDSSDSGAQLTNNSWGPTGTPQGYDIPTMQIDFISRDADPAKPGQQPVLAVWSIMNGNGERNFGACAPSSLGSPDEAKNLFAVGSTWLQTGVGVHTGDLFSVSANSAHGPACDGRRVPHIVAPGCRTDSTDLRNPVTGAEHGLKCGTSMASPVVSGSVALFWQRYRATHGTDPSPALVKALFSVLAVDLVGNRDADGGTLGHRPDRKQGWGRLDLDAVIHPPRPIWSIDQQIVFESTGQQEVLNRAPVDPTAPVRVMLAWTDAPGPGTGGTSAAWVNDLDVSVETDTGTFLGNVFGDDGFSTTGGNVDPINNMEALFLSPDQHAGGDFSLRVLAANIAEDALDPHDPQFPRQDFALVCINCQVAERFFSDDFEAPALR